MMHSRLYRALFTAGLALFCATSLSAQTPTARCTDGTLSTATTRQTACVNQGAVAQWFADSNVVLSQPAPAGAKARCSDGTYSQSNGAAACSGHGGVSAGTTVVQAAPAGARARRVDGTYSQTNGRGACAGRGGVAAWLTAGVP
jgi:hypothetical protein